MPCSIEAPNMVVPLKPTARTKLSGIPLVISCQVCPPSVDSQMPSPSVPASTDVALAAIESTRVFFKVVGFQIWPLKSDKKTPALSVPASTFCPLMASDQTEVSVRPLVPLAQVWPLSEDRYT